MARSFASAPPSLDATAACAETMQQLGLRFRSMLICSSLMADVVYSRTACKRKLLTCVVVSVHVLGLQVTMCNLKTFLQQLVHHVIPTLVPAAPLIPSVDNIDNVLLFPSLLFVVAVCKKQSHGNKVQQFCDPPTSSIDQGVMRRTNCLHCFNELEHNICCNQVDAWPTT